MSAVAEEKSDDTKICCASCGIAGVDDVKLTDCDYCHMVRYCSVKCQEDHRPDHEEECKQRAAELRDEILFKQPESSHLGDCPICSLPFPLDPEKFFTTECCSKTICVGCSYASAIRQIRDKIYPKCPFCRQPKPETDEEADKFSMKRIEANDPVAMGLMGHKHMNEGDYDGAFKYFTKAVEFGDADTHYDLSIMYRDGDGVEKDEKKELYHLEEAAIAGHPHARYKLGHHEGRKGRVERAVKHFIIAANLGWDRAIQQLKECYRDGEVSKEDFAAALRTHKAAVDATESPQRQDVPKSFAEHGFVDCVAEFLNANNFVRSSH